MYVCDAAIHKDAKGDLRVSVAAKYKIEVYEFDENNMIGEKPDTIKDLCAGCYNMIVKGGPIKATPRPRKQKTTEVKS